MKEKETSSMLLEEESTPVKGMSFSGVILDKHAFSYK